MWLFGGGGGRKDRAERKSGVLFFSSPIFDGRKEKGKRSELSGGGFVRMAALRQFNAGPKKEGGKVSLNIFSFSKCSNFRAMGQVYFSENLTVYSGY